MRLEIRKILLFLILLQLLIPLVYAGEWEDNASTVGTSSSTHPLKNLNKRQFYAEGLHWVFYSYELTKIGYRTSSDGISWSGMTHFISPVQTDGFTLVYDNRTGFCHFLWAGLYGQLLYERGNPTSGGVMSYNSSQTIHAGAQNFGGLSIDVDSYGYLYASYENGTGGVHTDAIKNSNNASETWTTAGGFPYQLKSGGVSCFTQTVVLDNDNVIFVYNPYTYPGADYVYEQLYFNSNSSWHTKGETQASNLFVGGTADRNLEAINIGNDVYMVYHYSAVFNLLTKRTWGNNTWATHNETNIAHGQSSFCMSYESITNRIYFFQPSGSNYLNITYYDPDTETQIVEELLYDCCILENTFIQCFRESYDGKIGVTYVFPESAIPFMGYTLRYSFSDFTVPPPPDPEEYILPVRLSMGLLGLVLIVLAPTLTVDQVIKKKNYSFLATSLILFSIGYALVCGWLVP